MSSIQCSSSIPSDSAAAGAYTSLCWCHTSQFGINSYLAMWSDISYSDNNILFRHLFHGHFTSRRSPAKASFSKFFAISNHSTECATLLLNPSYIARRWLFSILRKLKISDKLKLYEEWYVLTTLVCFLVSPRAWLAYLFSSKENQTKRRPSHQLEL
jgi:hypothetical protein